MNKRFVIDCNPFFIYVIAFLIPILLYQLNWSYLYPALTLPLLLFFAITFAISISIGIYVNRKNGLCYTDNIKKPRLLLILTAITIGNVIDFAYQRQIPLFSTINLISNDAYGSFGVPTFAVLVSTIGSFMAVNFFNCYRVTKEKKYLFSCLYLFIFPILIFTRGTILLNLSGVLFVYLFSIKKDRGKIYLRIACFLTLMMLAFGYAGNLRSNTQGAKDGGSIARTIMLDLGQATPSFEKSGVPPEFFWSYIYISSPLANLQYEVNNSRVAYTPSTVFAYFDYELIFDSISKRIGSAVGVERMSNELIAPYLTVGTIYSGSYTSLGWIGMIITFSFLMIISVLYIAVLRPENPYYATGIAILNTLVLFNLFDNMISFTAMSFQLLYPFLFTLKIKK